MCICDKKDCNGVCDASVGGRLEEFLSNNMNRIASTDLGALIQKKEGVREYYIVTGNQFYSLDSRVGTTKIMKDSQKVGNIRKENPFECDNFELIRKIKAYALLNKQDCYNTTKLISGIYDYKKVLITVEPDKQVDLNIAFTDSLNYDGKPLFKRCKVASVKWGLNEEGRFEGSLTCQAENDRSRAFHIPIEEYGKNYIVKSLIDTSNDAKANAIISMSRFGYIKPIILIGKKETIVIDNVSLYKIDSTGTYEIGNWKGNIISGMDKIADNEILKLINRYKEYIALHRKMIMPYLIGIGNKVEVAKLK